MVKTKKQQYLENLEQFLHKRAKILRNKRTKWEAIMYSYLKQIGYKFKFQQPLIYKLHGYIVDFLLVDYPIFIEADSKKHHSLPKDVKKDNLRSRRLRTLGYYPVRFTNQQITIFSKEIIDQAIKAKIELLKSTKN